MTLARRRLLFAGFILLFCLLVPIVLLYATGNSINWRHLRLEKTASILIDSSPAGASIYLNNEKMTTGLSGWFNSGGAAVTKAHLKNVLPGEYLLRLEREGYWPWEERINLDAGEAKNIGTVRLFKNSAPELVEPEAQRAEISPSGNLILLFKKGSLIFVDLRSGEKKEISLNKNLTAEDLNWSVNETNLSLGNLIINRENGEVSELTTTGSAKPGLVRWNKGDNLILHFVQDKKLFQYNTATKQSNSLPLDSLIEQGEALTDYYIAAQTIYAIVQSNSNSVLRYGRLNTSLSNLDLPSGNYRFFENASARPVLFNGKSAYVIDEPLPLFPRPRLLETGAFSVGRFKGDSLFYATPFELQRWDTSGNNSFLTRFGSPITALWPMENEESILVATPEDIRLYNPTRRSYTLSLARFEESSLLAASRDGKTAYIYGRFENITGLFRLSL